MERRAIIGLIFGGLASLLLTGFIGEKRVSCQLIRPPGALDESQFLAACARCGKCAQVCPQKAIIMGKGDKGFSIGTPYIEPREAACDLCLDCIEVCPTGALRPVIKEKVSMGTAENELFGTNDVKQRHFTAFSKEHDTVGGAIAEKDQVRLMNPMYYIDDPIAVKATHFRIRHGAVDRDTSLAISEILALKLEDAGIDTDIAHPWGIPHAGDNDLPELFDWIDSICK